MAKNSANNESASTARFGYVSAYDPARHMAKIIFPDKDNLISGWLPVSINKSLRDKQENHLEAGEHVFCVMQGNGIESGCVLCAIYDDTNKPVIGEQSKSVINFEDGTTIIYDKQNHELNISCVGSVIINSQAFIVNAPVIHIPPNTI